MDRGGILQFDMMVKLQLLRSAFCDFLARRFSSASRAIARILHSVELLATFVRISGVGDVAGVVLLR